MQRLFDFKTNNYYNDEQKITLQNLVNAKRNQRTFISIIIVTQNPVFTSNSV